MKTQSRKFALLGHSLLIAGALAMGGCGGGSGSSAPAANTISGTAAAGAPIVGTVTIKDSSTPAKTKFVTIAADGKYTIDVSGMTAPFMMRADGTVGGRSYSLYSAAASADVNGTVNVTPLTDLIVANVAGQIASSYFAAGNFSGLSPAALNTAEMALQARLQPILTAIGVEGSIDLLRTSFSTNHTGLDAALDILKVDVNPVTAQATITNVITAQQIVDDLASQADNTALTDTTNVATGLTDLQQIAAGFDAFSAFFATSLPASNNVGLNALFDGPNFLFDGGNLNSFLSDITSDPSIIGIKFTNVTLESLSSTVAQVHFSAVQSNGSQDLTFQVNKVGSAWKIAGNQRIAKADVLSFARMGDSGGTAIDTGIVPEIKDEGGQGIDYAIVTGKGLPTTTGGATGTAAGLLMVNYPSNSSFDLAQAGAAYSGISTPKITNGSNQYPLQDEAISQIADNEIYTVKLYDDNATPGDLSDDVLMATYTSTPGKRPYLNTELSAASFATITTTSAAINTAAQSTIDSNLMLTWTLPTGLRSREAHFWRSSGSSQETVSVNLVGTATSTTLTIPGRIGTVMYSGINLYCVDAFSRELRSTLNGQ